MKEQIIQFPNNLEVKEIKDGKIILVEKEEKLDYKNIAKKLFPDKKVHYYIDGSGHISVTNSSENNFWCENNTISERQAEKLLAINKLMNVAKYLNGDWQPDWSDEIEFKYYLLIEDNDIIIAYVGGTCCSDIYFKSRELAEQAIKILGEETIRLALSTDY